MCDALQLEIPDEMWLQSPVEESVFVPMGHTVFVDDLVMSTFPDSTDSIKETVDQLEQTVVVIMDSFGMVQNIEKSEALLHFHAKKQGG